jgi:hypothetical protein
MSKARPLAQAPIRTTRESLHDATPRVAQSGLLIMLTTRNSTTTTAAGVYHHAGQDYSFSMQPLQHGDFDASGFPMHIPTPKLAFNGFAAPPYINYLRSP